MVDAQVASTIDWPQSPQSPNHVLNFAASWQQATGQQVRELRLK